MEYLLVGYTFMAVAAIQAFASYLGMFVKKPQLNI